ncbi:MAG TPA: prepilin-type N-terminal cleavage/methylation domain-containing protein [Gemmatimonadaceae bacterium]|nr:prepilin-type N-terminal cleavage/methylation domain-containing protein [Gemmatimonadaceae bacterium]
MRQERDASRVRRGFTLVEILVAMTLTLAVFAITLPFVRAQTRALGASAGRLDADQVARYAQRAIDRDLRLASAVDGQPLLVQAGPLAISFNANLTAADTADPGALDLQQGAATTLTDSWRLAAATALPITGRVYPAADYLDRSGEISRHETISYFLRPDTISGRSDLYVLYRRVNARDSVQVVRALQVPADSAFFSYFRPVGGVLTRIAGSRLPLYWDSTAIDSIRSVGLRATGFYRERTTGKETLRTVSWTTVVPNAAGRLTAGCGSAPVAPGSAYIVVQSSSGPYRVEVRWLRSTDDGAGADDVRYYVIERRPTAGAAPWETLATLPARGSTTYLWTHGSPSGSGSYTYGVRAVDCAGTASARASDTGTLP